MFQSYTTTIGLVPVLLMFTAVFHKTHYHTYLDWQKQRAPLNRMISTEPGGPGIFLLSEQNKA